MPCTVTALQTHALRERLMGRLPSSTRVRLRFVMFHRMRAQLNSTAPAARAAGCLSPTHFPNHDARCVCLTRASPSRRLPALGHSNNGPNMFEKDSGNPPSPRPTGMQLSPHQHQHQPDSRCMEKGRFAFAFPPPTCRTR